MKFGEKWEQNYRERLSFVARSGGKDSGPRTKKNTTLVNLGFASVRMYCIL